ncbi:Rieske 2Fe-2S domain-containing protein [Nostocoides veronense]|uniref:Rieske domain-containing protein n=1 Tax=Nostocoides veronense TaxID=330836 RepID=A0ABP4YG11_9MICO
MSTHAGWYLLGFTTDWTAPTTPVRLGDERLMVVRSESADGPSFRVADSTCPHRGANLAVGGEVRGNNVVCPFHGRLIRLGDHPERLSVRTYDTAVFGPMLFVRLADGPEGDTGLPEQFRRLTDGKRVLAAVDMLIDVPAEYVVENAFDTEHFPTVHGVPSLAGMRTERRPDGTLTIGGDFLTKDDPWHDLRLASALNNYLGAHRRPATYRSAFRAVAYSPTVVATSFGQGVDDPIIVTGALPTPGGTHVRVAVIGLPEHPLERIAEASELAIHQDRQVWAHLDPGAAWQLDDQDTNVIAFRDYVADFPLYEPVRVRAVAR